ncbi:META domain-containing protein [Georgenia satyanarayanai]|uniref:META domain-containing protein n=1 Tax=Georgenia satyanarayanai TaxID=860221 RepID=UPI00203FDD72|nr:META domain-containing protein [Georgenia satyanarayanai]MCM3662145.1 META domain-containing protein [Georgenia satyanarayanai]
MRARVLLAAAVALLLLSGCAERPAPQGGENSWADPVDLVGLWRVSGAGEARDTWLRLDGAGLVLWRGSAVLSGSWTADGRTILAAVDGFSGQPVDDISPDWLVGAHAYRVTGDGWQLEDDDGAVVATLAVDGAPEPVDTMAEWYAEPPAVTDDVRAALAVPELPDGARTASAEHLLGRWVPAGPPVETDPYVVFEDDGTWGGSDGCNGQGGRWTVSEGRLLALSGPMTLIGCPGAPVGAWVGGASHAVVDGAELVLLGPDGAELGRLVRG